jgi:hypothetical protein
VEPITLLFGAYVRHFVWNSRDCSKNTNLFLLLLIFFYFDPCSSPKTKHPIFLIQIILQENQFGIWFYVTRYLAFIFSYLILKKFVSFFNLITEKFRSLTIIIKH